MKEKYFVNARIIDPSQNLDEVGGVIVDQKGMIKAIGKKESSYTIIFLYDDVLLLLYYLYRLASIHPSVILTRVLYESSLRKLS